MDTFKASEVFQIATRIEENGTQFYRHAMTVTGDAKIKDLFSFLADACQPESQYDWAHPGYDMGGETRSCFYRRCGSIGNGGHAN